MALDLTAAELAQRQREMSHDFSTSSAQIEEAAAARRQAVSEAPGQVAQGAFAGIAGAPVDLANMFFKAIGLGTEKPVLGSEWIGEKLSAKTESTAFNLGTALPVGPEGILKGAVGLVGMAKGVGKLEDVVKAMPSKGDEIASRFKPAKQPILREGKEVGYLKLDETPAALRIADIEVTASERNKGIGSEEIRKVMAQAKEAGKPVVLSSDAMRGKSEQKMQRALYERLGFVKNKKLKTDGVKEEYIWDPKAPPAPRKWAATEAQAIEAARNLPEIAEGPAGKVKSLGKQMPWAEEEKSISRIQQALDSKTYSVQDVPVKDIGTSQSVLDKNKLLEMIRSFAKNGEKESPVDNLPVVYQAKSGGYYVIDGNHRAQASRLLGRDTIRARLISDFSPRPKFDASTSKKVE